MKAKRLLIVALCTAMIVGNNTPIQGMQAYALRAAQFAGNAAEMLGLSLLFMYGCAGTSLGIYKLCMRTGELGELYASRWPLKITHKTTKQQISLNDPSHALPTELMGIVSAYTTTPYVEHTTLSQHFFSHYGLRPNTTLFLTDGQLAIPDSSDRYGRTIAILDGTTGKRLRKLTGHSRYISHLAELPQHRIATGDCEGTIKIWDTRTGHCLTTLTTLIGNINCMLSLEGNRLAITNDSGICEVYDLNSNTRIGTYVIARHNPARHPLVNNTKLYALDEDNITALTLAQEWDMHLGQRTTIIQKSTWNIRTHTLVENVQQEIPCNKITRGAAFLPDDTRNDTVAVTTDTALRIYQISTGKCLRISVRHFDIITACIALSNGNIVTASADETINIWNSQGDLLQTIEANAAELIALPDNKFASINTARNTITTWGPEFEFV